ncbi:MAG: small subunit ribosomal protein S17 [bacterium]|nr:MAG: small subunit ribosomal protein S17 [bacterium]
MSEENNKIQEAPEANSNGGLQLGRRAEKIGIVVSNKMMKTVVVRVDRLVRHHKYKRYIRRRAKFMAHTTVECNIGDKVRIIETRPLSSRKRWRVAEVLQKATL